MTGFRIRQIGLALCLMMTLAIGHVSACGCSHHVEKEAVKADCHSHLQTTRTTETDGGSDVCDTSCICLAGQATPYIVTKSTSKEFKAKDKLVQSQQADAEIEFVAIKRFVDRSPAFVAGVSYSTTLKSLLRSRAPPRL
jgi:hypothetical protein